MLRVGLRYTRDKTSMENFSARLIGNDFTPLASTIPGDPVDPFAKLAADSFTDKEWTGKLGVDFRLDSGALVYASFSHGYRSGAYNAQAFFDPSEFGHVAPETVNSFEVGIKTELMDRRVRFNAAAFYYDYTDQQFLDVDSTTAVQTLVNVEESEIMGLEAELTAIVSENLLIRAGLGILSTKVKKGVLSGVDLKGNDLPLAPSTNFNLTVDWTALKFESGSVSVIVDTSYVGDQHFDIFNLDRIKQDAYWLWNGRIQYDSASENWAVAIWGKNLAEEEYLTSAVDLSGFGYDYTHIGAPRTYGAEIIIRF
jgi:iron complex outermembrane receptor protein